MRGCKIRGKLIIAMFGMIFLLMSITYAGILNYYGKVEGIAKVKGPVFYADGQIGGVYYNLLINTPPTEEKIINFSDGNRIVFKTEPLGVDGFYKARFDLHLWVKTNKSGNFLQFKVIRIDSNLIEHEICTPDTISVGATSRFTHYHTNCSSEGEILMNPNDSFGLEIHGVGTDTEYWIMTGRKYTKGYTRIEVSKA